MSNGGAKPVRSPSYPNTPLSEAVAAVRKIEAQYRNAPVDRVDGAKIVGFSGLSGPANQALASLAHYGLVERAGKGHMKVTERARAILHPASEGEKWENLRAAASEPDLFRELQERFPNMTPPEDGVVTYLNRQGFNQTAIRPAAKAFLQTMSFLEEAGVSGSHGTERDETPESPATKQEATMHTQVLEPAPTPRINPKSNLPNDTSPDLNKINMDIRGGQVLIEGLLDLKGLNMLEKRIANIKALLEDDDDMIG